MYQTPELLAKQVIDRLAASQLDGTAVWIYTAHLAPENRHPRKMNMLAHLLLPLTQSTKCRPFFLTNNDILLVGATDLTATVLPIIDHMRSVLSDDPFIEQNDTSFFTVFNIKSQRELLLSALNTVSAGTIPPVDMPDLYPLIQEILKKKDLTDFLCLRPLVRLTPTLKQQTATLCTPKIMALLKTSVSDTSLIPNWMPDTFKQMVYTQLLDTYGFLNTLGAPIFLPVNAADVTSLAFDFFIQHRKTPTIFLFSPTEMLDEKTLEAAQKKCHALRYKWGFLLEKADQLFLIDFTKTGPDYIVVPEADLTPEMLPEGLKKETVLLTNIQNDTALFNALRAGFSLFEGPLIASIIGSACQEKCPYGDGCASGTCARIHAGASPITACVFPTFRQEYIFSVEEEQK